MNGFVLLSTDAFSVPLECAVVSWLCSRLHSSCEVNNYVIQFVLCIFRTENSLVTRGADILAGPFRVTEEATEFC